MKKFQQLGGAALAALLSFTALSSAAGHGRDHDRDDRAGRGLVGGVYTMDNAPGGNQIWAFGRLANGGLTPPRAYRTGGRGTGAGLGNQGSVLLSPDGRWLFACDAASDEISVFFVTALGLTLTDRVSSAGQTPVSLTLNQNLLYVLNAGGLENIAGFRFGHGRLRAVPDAGHVLSTPGSAPAQIAFTSDGDHLVVTEKATGRIDVFGLGRDGRVNGMKSFDSPAPPPFGFAAGSNNRIFVTQAAGGGANPGASSVSSYEVTDDGELEVISDSVATFQTAACWLSLTRNERFAFTANTPNHSISSFRVGRTGELELQESQAALPGSGSAPVDLALSDDDRYLYSLNSGNGTIGGFRLNDRTGILTPMGNVGVVPNTANGLAAR